MWRWRRNRQGRLCSIVFCHPSGRYSYFILDKASGSPTWRGRPRKIGFLGKSLNCRELFQVEAKAHQFIRRELIGQRSDSDGLFPDDRHGPSAGAQAAILGCESRVVAGRVNTDQLASAAQNEPLAPPAFRTMPQRGRGRSGQGSDSSAPGTAWRTAASRDSAS